MTGTKKLADAAAAKAEALLNPDATAGHNVSPDVEFIYEMATAMGESAAAGASAVTKLALGFQRLCADAATGVKEDMAHAIYKRHAVAHNDWCAANPHLGGKPLGLSDDELKSSVSTFRTFGKKGPRELGESLYARVRLIRDGIGEKERAQKSSYGAYVKVNREVHAICAKVPVNAFPTISDAQLTEWLTKKPTESDDLKRAYDAMLRAVEARPNDMALQGAWALIARAATAHMGGMPCDMAKLTDGTDFTWTAPLVKGSE